VKSGGAHLVVHAQKSTLFKFLCVQVATKYSKGACACANIYCSQKM